MRFQYSSLASVELAGIGSIIIFLISMLTCRSKSSGRFVPSTLSPFITQKLLSYPDELLFVEPKSCSSMASIVHSCPEIW